MKSSTTSSFRKAFDSLPPDIQERARRAFARFREDPRHPGLRLKKVHPSRPIYSARVRTDDEWIWFWIGSHDDDDRLLDRL